jgi:DNA-directed RNA polymerase subunit RPC12/RpoP
MVIELNRTLDQELLALMRGASLECPVCGEFVLHTAAGIVCPECGSRCLKEADAKVQLSLQAG